MKKLQEKVLVLNKSWQAIEVTTAQQALCDCFRGSATAINEDIMLALPWDQWMELPIRENDEFIQVTHGKRIRIPEVIVKAQYAHMPHRRPKLNRKGIGQRDRKICQYTGEYDPDGNIDHVVPLSRGGKNHWTNMVWSSRKKNTEKRDRTPEEAGMKLLRAPYEPPKLPACAVILRRKDKPAWDNFLVA